MKTNVMNVASDSGADGSLSDLIAAMPIVIFAKALLAAFQSPVALHSGFRTPQSN